MMKQEALARAAAASPNSQMAQLLAVAAADPKMKLSDLTGIINATNPNMGFETIDQGAGVSVIGYDKNGRIKSTAEFLPKSLSPKDIVNAETSRGNALLSAQATLGAADIRGQYGLAAAAVRAQGRSAGEGSEERRSAAEKKLDAQFTNKLNKVLEFYNMQGDPSREDMGDAVEDFRLAVEDGKEHGDISAQEAEDFDNVAIALQVLYAARFGDKNYAREMWGNFNEQWLQDPERNPLYYQLDNVYGWLTGKTESPFDKAREANKLPDAPKKHPSYTEKYEDPYEVTYDDDEDVLYGD